MTAVPPRPTAPEVHRMLPGSHEQPSGPELCTCGAAWDRWADQCTSDDRIAVPASPDATTGDGLREAIADGIQDRIGHARYYCEELADAVLALPALRDVLAAAARDAEKVRRVERALAAWHLLPDKTIAACGESIRRALDGTP